MTGGSEVIWIGVSEFDWISSLHKTSSGIWSEWVSANETVGPEWVVGSLGRDLLLFVPLTTMGIGRAGLKENELVLLGVTWTVCAPNELLRVRWYWYSVWSNFSEQRHRHTENWRLQQQKRRKRTSRNARRIARFENA